jgi:hypothetical protein
MKTKYTSNKALMILTICLIFSLLLTLSSCNGISSGGDKDKNKDNAQEIIYHTVTFNSVGGNEISSMRVKHGGTINQPATPVRENYIFIEWKNGATPWDFENAPVKEDITLTAHWVSADSVFAYEVIGGTDTVHITEIKYYPDIRSLTVPTVIKGYTVVGIEDGVFATFESDYIAEINIPETVSYVGSYAFEEVKVTINVYGSLSFVGEGAFMGCSGLTSVSLAEGLTKLPYAAFADCTKLTSIIIPEGIEIIEENAIKDCTSLLTVVIPSSTTVIENSAFHGCDALKSVFYGGSDEDFDKVDIQKMNDPLEYAAIYIYSEIETDKEGFWHFDDEGSPKIW